MLAAAITALFALAALLALLVIADSLAKARDAYAALVQEGALLRAGLVDAIGSAPRLRRAAGAAMPDRRRPAAPGQRGPRAQRHPLCAAA